MKRLTIFVMAFLFAYVCSTAQTGSGEHIYWVNSLKAPCMAVSSAHCLQVQKAEEPDPTGWELFYSPISGFEFEPGYIYKLVVNETSLAPDQVAADGSAIAYSLVKVLKKKKDNRLALNDIWILEKLNGKILPTGGISESQMNPKLEIQVREMKFNGTDGCNNYFGEINEITVNTLRFGLAAGTRMMCEQMEVPDAYNRILQEVQGYEVINLKLFLFDKMGNELMQFIKTD